MLIQVICHVSILLTIVFYGYKLFNLPIGSVLGGGHDPTKQYTLVFNLFVCMELFNEINSRRINNEMNIFEGIMKNPMFWFIFILSVVLQYLLVQFVGTFFSTTPLSFTEHLFCIGVGFLSLPLYQLARTVPVDWFMDMGKGKVEDFKVARNQLLDGRLAMSRSSLRSVTSEQYMNTPSTIPNLFSSLRRV